MRLQNIATYCQHTKLHRLCHCAMFRFRPLFLWRLVASSLTSCNTTSQGSEENMEIDHCINVFARISASECWWSLSVWGEVKDFSPAKWIRRFGQCSKISMSSSRLPWNTQNLEIPRAYQDLPYGPYAADINERSPCRLLNCLQQGVYNTKFVHGQYHAKSIKI